VGLSFLGKPERKARHIVHRYCMKEKRKNYFEQRIEEQKANFNQNNLVASG